MPIHPTGIFDYQSIDWSFIDMSRIIYKDCVVIMDIGHMKAGSFIRCIYFQVDEFKLNFIGEDGMSVVQSRDVRCLESGFE